MTVQNSGKEREGGSTPADVLQNREIFVAGNKIEIINQNHIVGGGGPVYVMGNTSACLVEGAELFEKDEDIERMDKWDSGSQTLAFAPDGSTILVQLAGEKFTEENIQLATSMFELALESHERLGIEKEVNLEFAENVHEKLREIMQDDNNIRVSPLFISTRIFGPENEAAQASATFNNKQRFLELVQGLEAKGVNIHIPTTFFYDPETYQSTGYPLPEELIASAKEEGSTSIFFKQNLSAGGLDIVKVDIEDTKKVQEVYDEWTARMLESRLDNSTARDLHIQIGVPGIGEVDGVPESPCIIATIDPGGKSFDILQVALQRLEQGTEHIGNIVDPLYEQTFLETYGEAMSQLLSELASQGVRGHVGIDVVVAEGNLFGIEINPRQNGNSSVAVLREYLPKTDYITTNGEVKLTAGNLEKMQILRNYFYDKQNIDKPSLVIDRFPRFIDDAIGLTFINDPDQKLEKEVLALLGQS